ncbi:MAG: hypothetical protein ACR2OZ_10195 [Verrucomicrobiales bacterium]
MIDPITSFMLKFAWAGMLAGVLSGAFIGLFFHRDDWMGGYGSFRRRLTRLGHISFFGLGFINFLCALTHHIVNLSASFALVAAWVDRRRHHAGGVFSFACAYLGHLA